MPRDDGRVALSCDFTVQPGGGGGIHAVRRVERADALVAVDFDGINRRRTQHDGAVAGGVHQQCDIAFASEFFSVANAWSKIVSGIPLRRSDLGVQFREIRIAARPAAREKQACVAAAGQRRMRPLGQCLVIWTVADEKWSLPFWGD